MKKLLLAGAFIAAIAGPAIAGSSVNPNIPAANSPMNSAPIRSNFQAAYTDINNILNVFSSVNPPPNPTQYQSWLDTSTTPATMRIYDGSQWVATGQLNTATHVWSPTGTYIGTPIAPAQGGLGGNFSAANGAVSFTGGAASAGVLPASYGGTGLSSGTSGGVPYFSSSSAIASSGALTANAIVLGGGAGAAPAPLGSLGTVTGVLHGNASGAPSWGAVALGTDVSGVLPAGSGGTGINNGSSTLSLAGSLATVGAFPVTFTSTASTNATLPAGAHTLAPLDSPNFTGTMTTTGNFNIGSGAAFGWTGRSTMLSLSDGIIALRNNAGTGASNLVFGSNTNSYVGLFPSGTTLRVFLGDSTGYAPLQADSFLAGTPTGGNEGAGTINVSGGYYVNGVAIPTSTAVSSVFGRTGAVVAATNDYTIAQINGLGTGIATFLGTPSSANLLAALTTKTGTGNAVFATSPALTTPSFSSIVNTGTLTLPTATDTLVGRATSDTLTNKTIAGGSNTITGLANASLTNSSITVNGTAISLGASGTVTAAAGTLTGSALASGVTTSSLTSLGGGSVGTAAFVNTGTSGATIPLLNAANTFGTTQTIQATAPQLTLLKTATGNWNMYVDSSNELAFDNGGTGGFVANFGGGPYFAPKTTATMTLGSSSLIWSSIYGNAYFAGTTAGVTCATGLPTASFASVNGIVTHC